MTQLELDFNEEQEHHDNSFIDSLSDVDGVFIPMNPSEGHQDEPVDPLTE